MSPFRWVVRGAFVAAFAAVTSACIPGFEWVWWWLEGIPPFATASPDASATPRKARLQGSAQPGGCNAQVPPGNAN